VKHDMYDGTSNNWSHLNGNKRIIEKFGSHAGETCGRITTQDSYTWNITHSTESTAYWNLKPEKKHLGVKETTTTTTTTTKDNNNNNNNGSWMILSAFPN